MPEITTTTPNMNYGNPTRRAIQKQVENLYTPEQIKVIWQSQQDAIKKYRVDYPRGGQGRK
jgi:hypothetical protein